MSSPGDSYQMVLRMSYAFFSERPCTPETLEQFIMMLQSELQKCGVSYDRAYSDLERLHNITVLDSSAILDEQGDHVNWFNPSLSTGLNREIDWHFWAHYREYLIAARNWPKGVVESIDRDTSAILSRLEDPQRSGRWDRRGMVMGSVQSGKTANYTALITKAIDAGYKLVVVLAGVHNSLRSQTQYRLNEEVLGYDLDKVQEFRGQAARIGVRAMFRDHAIAQTLTSSNEGGDFKKKIAEQAGIVPTPNGPAIIMVVKKHVSILKYLKDWATVIIGVEDDSGRKVVTDVPLLVIDDECDYASVDTNKTVVDENGNVDEECDPAKTNMRIRELLCAFHKKAYIGYTATPFANVFVHHQHRHPQYGEDLFPRNFIISLPQPTNYIGPERVFGLLGMPSVGIEAVEPLPLLRYVADSDDTIPGKHKKHLTVGELPLSLKHAIKAFLISCATRRLREASPPHNSMLVHVTRFTAVQAQIRDLVERELRSCVQRIQNKNDGLDDFEEIWRTDFLSTTEEMSGEFSCPRHSWSEVLQNLYGVARRIRVKAVNGAARDSLEYRQAEMEAKRRERLGEVVPWEERGEHVIAIGGDKLSRGLTLDGLTVSYYLRASRMYDTLMQMGRWFGYRDGYADLCRIYTTQELIGWYRFIATASLELRQELDYMALIGEEPKNFGLKVRSHPGQLAITSAGKRRNTEKLDLSYSGRISETVVFDLASCAGNMEALTELFRSLRSGASPASGAKSETLHWTGVPPEMVTGFLRSYKTQSEAARVVDPKKIAKFIEEQLGAGSRDLVTWDVAIVSRQNPPNKFSIGDTELGCLDRRGLTREGDSLTIKRLVSPSDEWIDFSAEEKARARANWAEMRCSKGEEPPEVSALPSGPAIRAARPKERGLLLIYPICHDGDGEHYGMEDGQEVLGFAVSFPRSDTTKQATYVVNSVYQDAED
ncbi:MAG: Z1 domain-containing protein [Candidatus Thorarchaeota archaeon]